MENPIKMDDLGGPPLFLETPTCFSTFSKKGILKAFEGFWQPSFVNSEKLFIGFLPSFQAWGLSKITSK